MAVAPIPVHSRLATLPPFADAVGAAPALAARGLSGGYDRQVIFKDVSFEVRPGELFFIIGGSGCGKSTLLRHLIGLQKPWAGEVEILGHSFSGTDAEERRERLRSFGVLFQSAALWSSMTVAENVALPLELHTNLSRAEREAVVAMKLAQVGLAGYEGHYPAELSGGMRKRAGLARALVLDPPVVFFDEPSAGLDPLTSRHLDDLILSIRDAFGTTMVIVSHELYSIFGIADRVILLDKEARGLIAEGRPRELLRDSGDERVRCFLTRGAPGRGSPVQPEIPQQT